MCVFMSEFYVHHMNSQARGGQKKVLDALEMESLEQRNLQEIVCYRVSAGNQTCPLQE